MIGGRQGARALVLVAAVVSACSADRPVGPSSNRSPLVRSITLTPSVVTVGGTAAVEVDAVDPDGDAIYFRYAAEAGTITPDPAKPSKAIYRNDGSGRGADRITVTVIDTNSAEATATTPVGLQANRSPEVTIAGEMRCHPKCTVTLQAVAADPEGDPLTYVWSGCATGTTSSTICVVNVVGQVLATVLVQDGRGGATLKTAVVEGTNAAPVVTGGGLQRGEGARFDLEAFDPDGDGLSCGVQGDCLCAGPPLSGPASPAPGPLPSPQPLPVSVQCALPAAAASCASRYCCTDVFGGQGCAVMQLSR